MLGDALRELFSELLVELSDEPSSELSVELPNKPSDELSDADRFGSVRLLAVCLFFERLERF